MITVDDYFGWKLGHVDATPTRKANANRLLLAVTNLLTDYVVAGFKLEIDPDTGTLISGSKGGAGDGGFRLQLSTTGRGKSNHKEGCAIDLYDPKNSLDMWITDLILVKHGLYREHPDDTPGWCHVQIVPPGSGRRTFRP